MESDLHHRDLEIKKYKLSPIISPFPDQLFLQNFFISLKLSDKPNISAKLTRNILTS